MFGGATIKSPNLEMRQIDLKSPRLPKAGALCFIATTIIRRQFEYVKHKLWSWPLFLSHLWNCFLIYWLSIFYLYSAPRYSRQSYLLFFTPLWNIENVPINSS